MILNDAQIREMKAVYPFLDKVEHRMQDGTKISGGVSSFGYDIHIMSHDVLLFRPSLKDRLLARVFPDTHQLDRSKASSYKKAKVHTPKDGHPFFVLGKGEFALAVSMESFTMPNDCIGICVGKSTYARKGLITPMTPLEPGWEGHLTLELVNGSGYPLRVYLNAPIAQVLFFRGDRPEVTYADRKGKYQRQTNSPVLPR